ncbi:MAG: ATP-binding protein [Ignavibacteriaceae bacterium]
MPDTIFRYFRLLYDNLPFPIEIINEEGKVIYINPSFSIQWGYNLSELNEYKIFNDSDLKRSGAHSAILKTFENKDFRYFENYADSLLKGKEITLPIFRTKIFHIALDEKNFVVLFHEDQTEIVLTESEVKKARDGNKEAERLKNTFLTVLSHELRTPLNIILGYSSIIKESMEDRINPEDKVYLDNLYSGTERLHKSISQMLEFAQIEAGNYKLKLEAVNLEKVIRNCIDTNKLIAREKKIEIKTKFFEDKAEVYADLQNLESAINNLINNAIKFTKVGFVEIETSVLIERELAVCKIKDSGIGISTDYLDHLFRPFSQEDLNIGRNYEGNGLGLALSKRYIEKMGGSLLVDSIKGVGTTFTFTLPLALDTNKVERNNASTRKLLKKILMLDDRNESSALLKAYLKNKFEIEVYSFNEFKLDFIDREDFEYLIFDVEHSQWDKSIRLCRHIKKIDALEREIIILSNEFDDEKIEQFKKAGVDRFLVKPFTKNDIIKALNEPVPSIK